MIGQNRLLDRFKELCETDNFPRFAIICGLRGSGKKVITKEVCKLLGIQPTFIGIKVDDVRDAIEQAYKTATPIVYVFADVDNMSIAAKNALLKVTEEPPNNAYFIMTLQDIEHTLPTIRSRATVFNMGAYSSDEIYTYIKKNHNLSDDDVDNLMDVCETPYEVNCMVGYGVKNFLDYVYKTIDNIDKVSGANSFKLSEKLSFKDDDGKYDLRLFMKSFMKICVFNMQSDPFKYADGVRITSKYLQELNITGINKMMLVDNWILDIRGAWL